MVEWVQKKEVAARLGISKPAISRMVREGKLFVGEDGKVEWTKELEARRKSTGKKVAEKKAEPQKQNKSKSEYSNNEIEESGEPVSDYARYQKHKADREALEVVKLQLKIDEDSKVLVPWSEVLKANEKLAAYLKTGLFTTPERICGELAGMNSPEQVYKVLMREFTSLVDELESGFSEAFKNE